MPKLSWDAFQNWQEEGYSMPTPGQRELWYIGLGIGGEAGETVEIIKKMHRPGGRTEENNQKLKLEVGDTLWYLSQLMLEMGWTLEEVLGANHEKIMARRKAGKENHDAIR